MSDDANGDGEASKGAPPRYAIKNGNDYLLALMEDSVKKIKENKKDYKSSEVLAKSLERNPNNKEDAEEAKRIRLAMEELIKNNARYGLVYEIAEKTFGQGDVGSVDEAMREVKRRLYDVSKEKWANDTVGDFSMTSIKLSGRTRDVSKSDVYNNLHTMDDLREAQKRYANISSKESRKAIDARDAYNQSVSKEARDTAAWYRKKVKEAEANGNERSAKKYRQFLKDLEEGNRKNKERYKRTYDDALKSIVFYSAIAKARKNLSTEANPTKSRMIDEINDIYEEYMKNPDLIMRNYGLFNPDELK